MANVPPYRVVTERLVIRCWDPGDAALLTEAIDSSLDHLRAWMPWVHDDPQPLAEKVGLLRRFRGRFDLGEDFVYGSSTAPRARSSAGRGCTRASGTERSRSGTGSARAGWGRGSRRRRRLP